MTKRIKFTGGSKNGQYLDLEEGVEPKEFINTFYKDKEKNLHLEMYKLTTWIEPTARGIYEKCEYKLVTNDYKSKGRANNEL